MKGKCIESNHDVCSNTINKFSSFQFEFIDIFISVGFKYLKNSRFAASIEFELRIIRSYFLYSSLKKEEM